VVEAKVSLLDQVRRACRTVAERAAYVRIDGELLSEFARYLSSDVSRPLDALAFPEHDPTCHFLGQGADTVAFFLTLDAINFGSGYSPHLRKRPGMSTYFTIAASLNDYYTENGPLSARDLVLLDERACAGIFGQDLAVPPVRELMGLFCQALNDLGWLLGDRYAGSFARLVEAGEGSAERLVVLLLDMPFFRDVSRYAGADVPLLKRAQITVADLALAFGGQGFGWFEDLDRLTIFADNLVPHVLRIEGVLRYDDDLLASINAGELIPAGSPQEVEIRACGLHAVELLVAKLRGLGHSVTARELDFLLWNRGQGRRFKSQPRHRTRTVYY
jgi:hypothetical protein